MIRKKIPVTFIFAAGISASSLFFASCGGGNKENENPELKDVEVTTDTVSSEVRVNFDLLRVNIPSPGVLTKKLTAAKISYNKSFLLSPSKSGSFTSNYQKALGLGAFGSDLGLAASYNQPQDALEYLGQMGKLSGDLGISSAFDPEFSKQLISKIGQPDTFQLMLDKAFDKAERNLRSNQRVATTVLLVAGGWIESLYTSVEALNTNPNGANTKSLYSDINVHCHGFEYIFQLLDAYKTNADCAKLIQDMEPYKAKLISIGRNAKIGPADLPWIRENVSGLRNKVIG
jgi:hypothetical protein